MTGTPGQPLTAARLALLARRARQDNLPALLREPIAVIGMGCRFPGGADTPESFWKLMLARFDAVREVPSDRWSVAEWYDPDPATGGRTSVKDGGFLDDASGFDAGFFGVSAREAERMDPHQRIALEVACEALEDAGLTADDVRERQVGVYVASYNNDYVLHQYMRPDSINERTITGVVHSIVANRISYHLGLHGPSITVDTACSSSLVAVHLACQALRTGGCDVSLVGGVSLMTRPEPFIAMSKAGFMAPDGRCKTFDARADGFGRGEGCGFIVLKRLSDALAAGDRIDAVIRGSAVNQDGRSTVLAAPNGRAQVEVVRAALADAQVDPASVGFVEAHGTGTRLGDPIEVEALAEALGKPRASRRLIASVKANIGHLEAAAGIAGLIKVVLCLRHRRIPPQVQFVSENPLLQLAHHGFEVPLEESEWPAGSAPVAGVSSFGVGGTNAHVVMEAAPAPVQRLVAADGPVLLLLSARTAEARSELALRYAELLERSTDAEARGIAAAAATRRTSFDERMAVAASNARELAERLRAGEPGVSVGHTDAEKEPRIVFVCSGQGSQWQGMARQLMAEEPLFRAAIQAVDDHFSPLAGWSLLDALEGRTVPYTIDDTACAQPLIFAVQVALARLFDEWGVRPFAVIGHSIGELAAAVIAGHTTLAEAVPMVFHRGRVMQEASADGAMLAARMTAQDAAQALARTEMTDVVIAGINSPRSVVFSGARAAVSALGATLAARGVQVKEIAVRYGFHSARMRPLEMPLRDSIAAPAPAVPTALLVSTVTGDVLKPGAFDPGYVARNIVSPVRFRDAVLTAVRSGGNVFLELGPRAVLGSNIHETLEEERAEGVVTAALTQRDAGRAGPLHALGALYCAGVDADWSKVLGPAPVDAPLPLYPWQHQRYWLAGEERRGALAAASSIAGERIDSPAIEGTIFRRVLDVTSEQLADHRIGGSVLVPGAMMLEMARVAAEAVLGVPIAVRDAQFLRPITLDAPRDSQLWVRSVHGEQIAELYTRVQASPWVLAFRAVLHSADGHEPQIAVDDAVEEMDAAQFYASVAERGCDFGDSFRRIRSLRTGAGSAAAQLNADVTEGTDALPPSLLDAALQPAIALTADTALYVPSSVESYRRLSTRVPHSTRVRLRSEAAAGTPVFDIDLVDDAGESVACVRGLLLRPAPVDYTDVRRSAMHSIQWQPLEASDAQPGTVPRKWIIADAEPRIAEGLRAALVARGAEVRSGVADAMSGRSEGEAVGWILCAPRDGVETDVLTYQRRLAETVLPVLRSSQPARGDRVILISHGAHCIGSDDGRSPAWGASLAGIARAARREQGSAFCSALDLDPNAAGVPSDLVEIALCGEPVLAQRDSGWLVPRMELLPARDEADDAVEVLELAQAGDISSIGIRSVQARAPASDEIEIAVRWGALNFRDVLGSLGVVAARSGGTLGHECAGVVTAVGAGVSDLAPGDEVVAMAEGAFGDRIVCRRSRVFRRPAGMDWASSVTLPIAYMTAYHALVTIAGVQEGQRVLIHSGAGGVGLAAIRIALMRGAVVYATAGSQEKRDFLLENGVTFAAHSRSTAFTAELLAATSGAGVDVVLNSLAGPAIDAGLDLLRGGGWFIELGKRDIRDAAVVARLHPGVHYAAFDLFDELDRDPPAQAAAYAQLLHAFDTGQLTPLPYTVYPHTRAAEAFQLMARGGHTGKILLSFASGRVVVRPDATYLVTGATGEVGLATAAWLIERGARSLVLASRTAPTGPAAERITALRQTGADVSWRAVDLTDAEAVRRLVHDAGSDAAPLRGIVHAAGALDDALLGDVDGSRFIKPFGAKVAGAWHVANAVEPGSLDFLLLYSAAGSLLDPAGQGSYAAANAVVDAMAAQLRARGLPATSVAWGLWQGGMAAGLNAAHVQRWHVQGLRPITAAHAAVLLDDVIASGRAVVAPLLIDWQRYFAQRDDADPVVGALRGTVRLPVRDAGRAGTRLREVVPHRQRGALREFLLECVSRVLGRSDLAEVGADRPLRDLGLDSLMAVELRNMLTRELGHAFSATLAFDYPDIPALTAHIAPIVFGVTADNRAVADRTDAAAHAMSRPITTAVEELIDEMTDEEAERLLMEELQQLGAQPGKVQA